MTEYKGYRIAPGWHTYQQTANFTILRPAGRFVCSRCRSRPLNATSGSTKNRVASCQDRRRHARSS